MRAILREDRREQIELLLEQRLVLIERESKQRKRLGERAASEDYLGTPIRRGVERREPLKYTYRIVGAEYGDRRAEVDPFRLAGDRGEDDLRRRDREVGPVMLADAEEVHAHLIGKHRLGDDVPNDCRMRAWTSVGVDSDVAERVQPEF